MSGKARLQLMRIKTAVLVVIDRECTNMYYDKLRRRLSHLLALV